jgi:P4 family phage/plasmid primase-like protien
MTTRNPFAGGDTPAPPAGGSGASGAGGAPSSGGGEGGKGSAGGGNGRIRALVDPDKDLICARLPLTDLGNAERWRVRFGDDFRFCPEIGWFAWDGRRWKMLSEEKDRIPARVMQSVFVTVRAIRNEAALVAASGYPPQVGLSDKELRALEAWTDAEKTSSWDMYLAAVKRQDPEREGEVADWLSALEPMDMVLGKKLWSQSIAAWAKTSEGKGKLESIASLAKSFDSVTIGPTEMDADRMAINVLNGTLRLVKKNRKRTDEEKAAWLARHPGRTDVPDWVSEWQVRKFDHDRADLISKLAPVKYSPGARCADYDAFLARVQPDEHMRRFIHQWGGLSLTGDIGEHKLAFFYGGGRNGKGTWVELVAAIAGEYAGAVQFESLADTGGKRRGDQATPDLAELPGVRFLRIAEPSAGVKFDDGLVKQLTGGDPVKARFLNKGFFEFLPSFKITISGNNKPNIRDTSHGFWARMQLVPWAVTIPEEEIDHRLPDKLREQASGVLNRLIEGLLDWRRNGLIVPEQVRMATREYRDQSDDLGRFLAQCCLVSDADESLRVGAQELFDTFRAWADATGGATWTMKGFKKAMEDRGFRQKPSNGMKWLRVGLKAGVSANAIKDGYLPEDGADGGSDDDWVPPEMGP